MQNNIFFKTKNLRMLIFLGYISFEFTFKAYLTVLVRTVYFNKPFPLLFGKNHFNASYTSARSRNI